jgi:hypothetical protein
MIPGSNQARLPAEFKHIIKVGQDGLLAGLLASGVGNSGLVLERLAPLPKPAGERGRGSG